MMIAPAVSTMINAALSILSRVRRVSGRKIAKTSAFQTQPHFSIASTGKSANIVDIPQ